jgi:hypothetical protein
METARHWDKLAKNQPAEIAMFQISEVQESPAFNGRRSFLALRPPCREEKAHVSAAQAHPLIDGTDHYWGFCGSPESRDRYDVLIVVLVSLPFVCQGLFYRMRV